jgi:hypothetical protein
MLYIILRGCWCDIILNVHAPISENNSDDTKDIFYEKVGHVFDQFLKYHMKILLDLNAEVGREVIFQTNYQKWRVYMKLVMTVRLE